MRHLAARSAAVVDWRRGDRRSAAQLLKVDPHAPQRIHYLAAALFVVVISVYRSAVPFEFRPNSMTAASDHFSGLPVGAPDGPVEP